jgi:two-component system, chemotaxis family, chemotaxis protein CheY
MSPTTREQAANALRASPPRILVADADVNIRALYRDSFTAAGYDVVEACDGREALVKAISQPPTLVVTEISLPFIDGCALCEVLRRDRTTADVPLLVITTEARPAQIDRARKAGADVVLIKPTPIEIILNEIRRLVAGEPAAASSANATTQRDESANRLARSKHERVLSKSFPRMTTTTPPTSPPELRCPSCDRWLRYEHSEIGGVSRRHPEQWDYYTCATCGRFQHRQRTRKLRSVS